MSRALRSLRTAVACGVGAVGLFACSSAVPEGRPPGRPGVRFGFADNAVAQGLVSPRRDARLLASAGARIARVQLDWRFAEPRPGEYHLERFDAMYQAYRARRIRMLLIFAYAPPWASARLCLTACLAPPARAYYGDAARMAARLAERYPRLAGIEIWNEPNTPYYWGAAPDPQDYAELLRACYSAIKAVRPKLPVVGGSLANATSAGSVAPAEFLTGILAEGAVSSMDALSIHPYPDPGDVRGDTAWATTTTVIETLRSAGADGLPVWATELGISTTGENPVTERQQAEALVNAIRRLRSLSQLRMILVHTLIEPKRGLLDRETGFGVVRSNLHPKAAYCQLARAATGRRPPCARG